MKYGTPSGRMEHCQQCALEFDVDEAGRVPQHRKRSGYGWDGGVEISLIADAMCVRSGHVSREERARRKGTRLAQRVENASTSRDDARVALDSYLEGRDEFADRVPEWRRAALALYNERHRKGFAHAYEYATRCAPDARRAKTLGDIYCRFCGERLFSQVKDPHHLVAGSADAQRHLTICALQLLAGMRPLQKPGYRSLPFEQMWREDQP